MKKSILLLSAIFLTIQFAFAQKPDQAVALVRYAFSHIRDTTDRAKVYTENMELVLGKNGSVYRSADLRLHTERLKNLIAERAKTGTTSMMNMAGVGGPRGSSTEFFQFQAEKKMIRQEKLINLYLLEEALPVIDWKITSDTTSFGTLHCQKATTTFKGRTFEVWFCPALSFRSGPWKLNGLPGLIVEANDSKKEVVWNFAGLEDAKEIAEKPVPVADAGSASGKETKFLGFGEEKFSFKTIELPQNGIKTTEKEFTRLKETMKKDPMAFVNSALAASGSTAKIVSMTPPTNPVKNTINNPIELTDKP